MEDVPFSVAHQNVQTPLIVQPGSISMVPMGVTVPLHGMSSSAQDGSLSPTPLNNKDLLDRNHGQFQCAHCHTTQIISQLRRGGVRPRKGKNGQAQQELMDDPKNRKPKPARPRSAVVDGQKVLLCNACGIYWQRKGQKRPIKPVKRTSARKKPKSSVTKLESPLYHAVAEAFSQADADLLWCDCSQLCTTRLLMLDQNDKSSLQLQECQWLIETNKKALMLKKMKSSYGKDELKGGMDMSSSSDPLSGSASPDDKRGYGRGRSSSKEYEHFVFQHIDVCKQKKLCANFRKRLLSFSNDWLYKRPSGGRPGDSGDDKSGKMEGKPRVLRDKKFEFTPEEMKNATCCSKLCCQQIWTNQIAQWRREYLEGNIDQRWNVIQFMLLGEGYGSSKCVNVVRMITGCSRNLVASVRNSLMVNQCTGRPPARNIGVKKEEQPEDFDNVNVVQSLAPIQPLETIKSSPMHQQQHVQHLSSQAMQQSGMHGQQMQHQQNLQGLNMGLVYPSNYYPNGQILGGLVAAISSVPSASSPAQQQQQQMQQQMQHQQAQQYYKPR